MFVLETFCQSSAEIWLLVGKLVNIIKIVIVFSYSPSPNSESIKKTGSDAGFFVVNYPIDKAALWF